MPQANCESILERIFLRFFDDASLRALFGALGLDNDLLSSPVPYGHLACSAATLASRHGQLDWAFFLEVHARAQDEAVLAQLRELARCLGRDDLADRLGERADCPWPPEGAHPVLQRYAEHLRIEASWLSCALRDAGARGRVPMVDLELRVSAEIAEPASRTNPDLLLFGWARPWVGHLLAGAGDLGRGPLRLTDLLDRADARYVVLGDPGSGKSALLVQTALEILEAGKRLPILLEAGLLEPDLRNCWPRHWPEGFRALAQEAILQGRAVLLVDGIDGATDPEDRHRGVAILAARHRALPMVITSRPVGYRAPSPLFQTLAICPLSPESQRLLLSAWMDSPERAERAWESLTSSARTARLVESPLVLTLVALLLRGGATFQVRRAELFRRLVKGLLQRDFDPERPARSLREPADALELIAWAALRLDNDERSLHVGALEKMIGSNPGRAEQLRRTWTTVRRLLVEVSELTGLLVPLEPAIDISARFAFPHRAIWEFLAAYALEADIASHRLQSPPRPGERSEASPPGELAWVLQRARANPEAWEEVLALTCAMLRSEQATQLVRWVETLGSRELTLRVLEEAPMADHDTIRDALGLEQDWRAWEQRAWRIRDIVAQAKDPSVIVRLLDQYRSGTRDGCTLYWISASLEHIAASPDACHTARREAREAAQRIFAHMEDTRQEALELLRDRWRTISASPCDGAGAESAFEAQMTPVTWRQYLLFDPAHRQAMEDLPGGIGRDRQDALPVYNVTWYAATMFARWVGGRLPTAREWERACGDVIDPVPLAAPRVGWSLRTLQPAGSPPRSRWGLADVRGGVWEWSADPWHASADGASAHDAPRVAHGGSWRDIAHLPPGKVRTAFPPGYAWITLGLRVVRDAAQSSR